MELIITGIVLLLVGVWWGRGQLRRKLAKQPPTQSAIANTVVMPDRPYKKVWESRRDIGGVTVATSAQTRIYDPDAYRFDGSAHPQFRISYADEDGVVTERDIYVDRWHKKGNITYYNCWCFLRDEKRTFRSDRILDTINIDTNRRIKDISAYMARY